jgi:phosphatidylinositol alpha-1,6-mannosyltransferase
VRTGDAVLRAAVGSFRRPDCILFTHIDLARLPVVLPHLRAIPYAVWIYGTEVWRPLDRWRRSALEHAAAVITISNFTMKKAREVNPWLPDAQVVWLGTEEALPVAGERAPTVLILGRMASVDRYKGHDVLIDIWPQVQAAVPSARLMVVGDGDDRARLEARAAGSRAIVFTGFVSDDERRRLLRSCAVLASISTGEGFGLAALEAAAAGMPVVALRGTVAEELFPDGNGHVFLDTAEPHALAQALISLLTNQALSHGLGESGRRRMREAFGVAQFNQRIRSALAPLTKAGAISRGCS